MAVENLTSVLESILFAADRPVSLSRFKEVFGEEGPSEEEISENIAKLKERYLEPLYGIELREAQGGFQFVTKAHNAEYVRRFLETKPFRLGRSALEVLAIIAYRQPITRAEIDAVRGIDSSHLMRTLIERDVVRMAGKAEVPGRPVQYGTTPKFLELVGLNNINELPPLSEFDQLQGNTEDPLKQLESGLERFITEEIDQEVKVDDQKGLEEIDTLITSAHRGSKEVYESKEHAEVAEENERAVEALNSHPRPRRKKNTVTFEELQAEVPPAEEPPNAETLPELPQDSVDPIDTVIN